MSHMNTPVKMNLHSSVLRLLVLGLKALVKLHCCLVSACVGLVHGGCGLARFPFRSAGEGNSVATCKLEFLETVHTDFFFVSGYL